VPSPPASAVAECRRRRAQRCRRGPVRRPPTTAGLLWVRRRHSCAPVRYQWGPWPSAQHYGRRHDVLHVRFGFRCCCVMKSIGLLIFLPETRRREEFACSPQPILLNRQEQVLYSSMWPRRSCVLLSGKNRASKLSSRRSPWRHEVPRIVLVARIPE